QFHDGSCDNQIGIMQDAEIAGAQVPGRDVGTGDPGEERLDALLVQAPVPQALGGRVDPDLPDLTGPAGVVGDRVDDPDRRARLGDLTATEVGDRGRLVTRYDPACLQGALVHAQHRPAAHRHADRVL